jgi:AcrR family transcriptional regulator
MTTTTRQTILKTSKQLFARHGYEGFSMRTLSKQSGVGLSSVYHFFSDKDEILKELFNKTNTELGEARKKLPKKTNASDMLLQRIVFQFQHIEDVVFVLKYYIHFRPKFLKLDSGYIPKKGYLHIEEVLQVGVRTKEFAIAPSEIDEQAKIITHAINGFLLEYYPKTLRGQELSTVTKPIHLFLLRSLTNKEVVMRK